MQKEIKYIFQSDNILDESTIDEMEQAIKGTNLEGHCLIVSGVKIIEVQND